MKKRNKQKSAAPNKQSSINEASSGLIISRRIILASACFAVLAFYLWTAGSNGVPFIVDIGPEEYYKQVPSTFLFPDVSPHHYGHYNLMADAFAKGRADLLLDPPKELLQLPNPRDPAANAQWRILDLSIYKGRYYLYFGPVPTLTLFLPLRWLGVGKISEALATIVYCYGLFLCSVYILLTCVKRYFPTANSWLLGFGVLALGLSNATPYILRHPSVYEVAISSAAFFSMLALAFLAKSWDGRKSNNAWLLAASFSLGVAIGCRPIYVFAIIFLFGVWLLLTINQKMTLKQAVITGCALAFPFFACLMALLWFNYVRFGSFSDFGIDRQMNATLWNVAYGNRICNILPGLFLRVFCPPQLSDIFPFVRLHQFYPGALPEGYSLEEVSGGFLATSPVTLLYFLIVGFLGKTLWRTPVFVICALLLAYGSIILFIESYMMFCNSMRYQLDFAPPILLGSIIGCLYIQSTIKSNQSRKWSRWGLMLLLSFGIASHVLISLTGFRDTLRRGEPNIYFSLEDLFKPISAALHPFVSSSDLRVLDTTPSFATIRFSDGSEGFPITGKGFYIRFNSPGSARMVVSADIVLFNAGQHAGLHFINPDGYAINSQIDEKSFQRWEIVLHPGPNRVAIFLEPLQSNADRKDILGYINNLQMSPVQQ